MSVPSLIRFKRCTKCSVVYPASRVYFSPHRKGVLGLTALCKACSRVMTRNYRLDNPEKEKASRHAHYWKDIEKSRALLRNKARARYKRNGAAVRAKNDEWRLANKERVRLLRMNYKARKRGATGSHTLDEIWQMHEDQTGLCAYCEMPLFGEWHVDHMVPLSKGGTNGWENLAVVCVRCNLRKHTASIEEFLMVLLE